jgi:hypothetical protein
MLRVGDASFAVKVFARKENVVSVDSGAKEPPDTRMSWGQVTLVKSAESPGYTSAANRRLAIFEKTPGEFTLEHKMQDVDTTSKVSAALTCLLAPTSASGEVKPPAVAYNKEGNLVVPWAMGNEETEPSAAEYAALKACIAFDRCVQDGCEIAILTETKKDCVSPKTTLVSFSTRCGGPTLSGYKNANGKEFENAKLGETCLSLADTPCGTPRAPAKAIP